MVCAWEVSLPCTHHLSIMTTSFITETIDQELPLTDLQDINGGVIPLGVGVAYVTTVWALGLVTGAAAYSLYDDNREEIADSVHDAISEEDNSSQNGGKGRKGGKARK